MLKSKIEIRTLREGFSVDARYNPGAGGKGTFFFGGHIEKGVCLESAFGLIKDAIADIEKLTEGRETG
jgi:hypothetical protein